MFIGCLLSTEKTKIMKKVAGKGPFKKNLAYPLYLHRRGSNNSLNGIFYSHTVCVVYFVKISLMPTTTSRLVASEFLLIIYAFLTQVDCVLSAALNV